MHEKSTGFLAEKKACKILFAVLSLLLTIIVTIACVWLYFRAQHVMQEEMLETARMQFHNILLVRRWNAGYGGVYVKKEQGVKSNPYLENPDLHTIEGFTLTLKNPALMTREISELTHRESNYSFHITSLKPLNPANKPDEFERKALQEFEKGEKKEAFQKTKEGDKYFFNYIAPIFIEESCLRCHEKQGYKVGDVRGGILVRFNTTKFIRVHNNTVKQYLIFAACFTIVSIIGLYCLIHRFSTKLDRARKEIRDLAIRDPLTGIYNRRFLMSRLEEELERSRRQGTTLCCIILDIDHFKQINDRFGHLFGDAVLKELTARIQKTIRPYDTFARYGGEEFVLIQPNIKNQECGKIAHRVLEAVRSKPFTYKDAECDVTVSMGISFSHAGKLDSQTLLKNADTALYQAKRDGRNRMVIYQRENA